MEENISSPLGLLAGGSGARGITFLVFVGDEEGDEDDEKDEERVGDLEREALLSPEVDGTRLKPGDAVDVALPFDVEKMRNQDRGLNNDQLRGGLFVFR